MKIKYTHIIAIVIQDRIAVILDLHDSPRGLAGGGKGVVGNDWPWLGRKGLLRVQRCQSWKGKLNGFTNSWVVRRWLTLKELEWGDYVGGCRMQDLQTFPSRLLRTTSYSSSSEMIMRNASNKPCIDKRRQ